MSSSKLFRQLEGPLGRQVQVKGHSYLYFGGTAYLGMPVDVDFLGLYQEGLRRYGINNGTSRNNNIQLGIYDQAEREAASRFGAADSLIMSSGYLAAQLCVRELSSAGQLEYAPGCHPALWLGNPVMPSGNFTDWAETFVARVNAAEEQNWVLVSNSMNNLLPELYDFSFLKRIVADKRILLLVDDSHGLGVLDDGAGVYRRLKALFAAENSNIEVIVVASMAKALGIDAGLILGSEAWIEAFKKTHEFVGASPPAAAALYAFIQGGRLYQKAFAQLKTLQKQMLVALQGREGFSYVPGFPVYLSQVQDLANHLLEKNILISSFPYPDQDGPALNRIILCSWHAEEDLDCLLKGLP
jgi:8-amino-7-oxononanoate synthase